MMYLADDATEEELREMAETERNLRSHGDADKTFTEDDQGNWHEVDMKVITDLLHTNPWDA